MAISRSLRNLLRVRDLEEEQQKGLLGAALAELHALESALAAAQDRRRAARCAAGAASALDETLSRRAYELEIETQARREALLAERCEASRQRASEAQTRYLDKRTERRQAESLVEAAQLRDAKEADRRQQRELDAWYAGRIDAPASENE